LNPQFFVAGMNTGIQDAHNLAWKVASVIKGIAPTSMLNTYDMERRPISVFNTRLSLENYRAAMSVPATLGLNPTVANTEASFGWNFCYRPCTTL
jgi:2-polyprenyl-6-methoxyphenol hydroxylase-like FAD-dependent oxidoreductase